MANEPVLRFEVLESGALPPAAHAGLLALFRANYADADPEFLDRSLATLARVAVAWAGDEAVGFALGETRHLDLPALPDQLVNLAGLACVAPSARRRGLFGELTRRAMGWEPESDPTRRLFCGRVAHAAAYHSIARMAGVVPRAGVAPSPWQQQVGSAIAAAYRVHAFDPRTFVCIGRGRSIGTPRIELECTPDEARVFASVDRSRGDALLALAWHPHAPPGWSDPEPGSPTPTGDAAAGS